MTPTLSKWWQDLPGGPRDFLVTPAGSISRADLVAAVRRFAGAFADAGIVPGDRVVIVCADEPAAIAAFCACVFDGVTAVMLAADTSADRVSTVVEATAPKAIVTSQERAGEAWTRGAARCFVFNAAAPARGWFQKAPAFADRLANGFGLTGTQREPRLPADPEGLAYILFTSGTTSSPSGVMISRRSLQANVATIARVLGIEAGSRVFNDMVLAHGDGLVQGPMMALGAGATLIRGGGFSVDRLESWLETVRREGATHFITVPTIWALIDRYAQSDDYFDGSGFRGLSSVAAYLEPGLWHRIETRFRQRLTNQYGLTETAASALYAGPHPEAGSLGVGRPVDCEIRILGHETADQGTGELQIHGDNIFSGYWNDPVRTADTLTPDGWLRTGDLARVDAEGNVQIVGRIKTTINSAGYLIRPEEIDEAIGRFPGVLSSVTVGLPDEIFGEVAVSLVEAADGALDETALTAHVRTALDPLKVPKRIMIVDQIPRGNAGKPQMGAVRQMIAALSAATKPSSGPETSVEAGVIETAAQLFRVPPASLTSMSTPTTVKGWDSFQHVALIMALEERFGIRIPTGQAAAIRSLGAAIDAVRGASKS